MNGKYSAPSGPAPASQKPVRLPGEPILFEKDGWGIYTMRPGKDTEGSTLTHIGCDCDFPYWAFSHLVIRAHASMGPVKCTECKEVLSDETYKVFAQVYQFINGLNDTNGCWGL